MLCTAFEERDMYRLRLSLSVTPIRILTVNKILRNLGRILHLYSQKSVCATRTRPFGEVGGKSPLRLSSQTHFA